MWRSVRQTPQAATRSSTCPSCGSGWGSSSSCSGSPGAWSTIARTTRFSLVESTLPYAWYVDPEILRREQELILRPAWQYAGHVGQLGAGAGFFATRAGRTPVVVTRDGDGAIRAFGNVRPPRGTGT